VFCGLSGGAVMIAKKEPRADDGDPVIRRCLAFLAHDMAIEPARIRPVPRLMVSRGKALVKGVRVDLNAPIRDDKA
jgi:antitoxin PrlF